MSDPAFEQTFQRETHTLQVERLRVALTVGVGLYLSFWVLDLILAPAERWHFLAIRLTVSAVSALVISSTYAAFGKRWVTPLAMGVLLLASFGISWMTMRLGGFASHYYAGNMLVLFFAGLFMPWALGVMIAFCVLLCAGYFGLNLAFTQYGIEALAPAFFLVGTGAFTCLANIASRASRRRDLELRLQLEHANRDLQRVDEAKTRFFSNVSHELRTPLMLILGPLEAVRAGGARSGPLLDTMAANAQRLLRQVNMLLDFSKLEAGRLTCKPVHTHVGQIVQKMVASARPFATQRGVKLFSTGLDALPETDADPEHVETIAANLISNAVKFTPSGGEVEVSARIDGDMLELVVRDSGVGIPEDEIDAIFDRFHQVEGEKRPEGTGLGLALVKELVALHRGEVRVSSRWGAGSTFVVRMPRELSLPAERRGVPRRREDRVARALVETMLERRFDQETTRTSLLADLGSSVMPANDTPPAHDEHVPRLLLVEDNDELRAFVGGELGKRYRVETAVDGLDGLNKARALMPDVVVSDLVMPKLDGQQLCAKLKADPTLSSTPVILLTAKAGPDAVVEGLQTGADDYVTKPFDMRELCARIDAHLRSRSLERKLHERESRLAAIGQYTSTVAHDIRSPLQAIVGFVDLASMQIAQTDADSPALGDLVQAQKAAARAEAMMQKVVEFARSGSIALQMEALDGALLLRDIHGDLSPVLREAGVTLHVAVSGDLRIQADSLQLRRVIENLINNARDALSGHDSKQIWLQGEAVEDGVRLTVSDNGPGVPEALRETLFQPFASGKATGFGLGLAIVSNLMRAHGGEVSVDARGPNGGAHFVLALPRSIPVELTRQQVAS